MKISSRYKVIGKRKRAILEIPYNEALSIFEEMLCNSTETRLVGSVNRNTGVFKLEYKLSAHKNDVYENYCMLVELSETENGGTKIEYAFVYDRLISLYTKLLSVICFIVPLVATGIVYFKFELKDLIHLAIYVPLILISAFGVFSLFGYKERKSDVKPMIREFEEMLISEFN